MVQNKMSPFLKWAGGKTQLLEPIAARIPETYNRYFEPFIGGGAVFLSLAPSQAFINDINRQLINLYRQIKENPDAVIKIVNTLDAKPCNKEFYYTIREHFNKKISSNSFDAECAAFMIWLNKHCYNGLYRVNKKGLFNVPYNNKVNGKSIDENNLRTISSYLQKSDVTINCLDFEAFCQDVRSGDFVYFDSPYIPESATANFTSYTTNGFSFTDHERLAALFKYLDKIGAKLLLSNNDVPFVHHLYSGYHIQPLDVKRMINRNGAKRTGKEVLVTNY
ncbi:DNA adenine methylase [Anaerotignum faecicola]